MVNGLWFILGIIEVYLQIWYRYLTAKSALSTSKFTDQDVRCNPFIFFINIRVIFVSGKRQCSLDGKFNSRLVCLIDKIFMYTCIYVNDLSKALSKSYL
jgi:hypothetical protein